LEQHRKKKGNVPFVQACSLAMNEHKMRKVELVWAEEEFHGIAKTSRGVSLFPPSK